MFRRLVTALAALVAGCVFAGAASAATYYVSPSGSDANGGTSTATAWKTVARVNRAGLAPGDTVLFEGGQTFSDASLMPPTSGTAAAPITFGSYGGPRAKLVHSATVWLGAGLHDLVFQDLDLTTAGGSTGIFTSTGSGSGVYDVTLRRSYLHDTAGEGIDSPQHADHDWLIEDDTVTHTGDSGVILWGASDVVQRNVISDTGSNAALTYGKHGVYAKGPDMTIANNDFSQNQDGQSISIRFHGARVVGNTIHDTPYAIAFFDYDTTAAPQGTSYVYGNRLWDISGWGFYYDGQVDPNGHAPTVDFLVASNTFELSGASEAVNVSPSGSAQVTLANNVFAGSYGSGLRRASTTVEKNNDWFGGSSNVPSGPGDLHVDPKLNAPSSLAPAGADSAVVDRGSTAVGGLTYSAGCDGHPLHYCGSAPEIGGVEYLAAPPPPPDLTPPSTPSGLAPWSATDNSLTFVWTAATDNVGVAGYDVFVNGGKVATLGSTSASVGGLACGTTYVLGVQALDAAGNRSATATLSAATSPCPGADTVAPVVTITSPGAGANVGTAFTVSASATDLGGVTQLRFLLNGVVVCVVPAASGSCALTANTGWNTVTVDATDAAGNVGSARVRLRVVRTTAARTTARVSARSSLLHFLRARR